MDDSKQINPHQEIAKTTPQPDSSPSLIRRFSMIFVWGISVSLIFFAIKLVVLKFPISPALNPDGDIEQIERGN